MKIAIISDTHSLLRPEVEQEISGCDMILHGGDIASPDIYNMIKTIAPTYFVRGNADKDWADDIPNDLVIDISGYHFYMVHNIKHARTDLSNVDFFIYGHSHKYENKKDGDVTFLNPGSCGPRRFTQPVTMMIMTINGEHGPFSIEKKDFSPVLKRGMRQPPQKEMDKLIKNIIKDMDANRPVEIYRRFDLL